MQLLIGTNNEGKFIEISEVLRSLPLTLLSPKDCNIVTDPEETGSTFAENALQKAQHFFELAQIPTLADDSGIHVEALAEELGIHTRRWGAGPTATDEEWVEFFLKRMSKEGNKNAQFVCTMAYIDKDGSEHIFEGICNGTITETLETDYLPGLPISACFKPEGFDNVFSALTLEEKNAVSHRGKAAQSVLKYLESLL